MRNLYPYFVSYLVHEWLGLQYLGWRRPSFGIDTQVFGIGMHCTIDILSRDGTEEEDKEPM